jgi:uncharacterized membrane protein
MRCTLLAIVFYLITVTAALDTAQGLGIEVRPAEKEVFEAKPKEIISLTFRVTNTTSRQSEFVSEVKLPEGWDLITEDFPFELSGNEATTKLVSFIVPETAEAGRYKITYLVKMRKYPSIHDFYTVDVVVLPHSKLEVKLLETPQYITAGEYYQVRFLVTNNGNTENTVSMSIDSSENIPFTVDTDETLKLTPWQSKTVTVWVEPDAKMAEMLKHRLRLTAQIVGNSKPKTQAKAESIVEIISRAREEEGCFKPILPQIQSPQGIAFKKNIEDNNKPSMEGRPLPNSRFILGLNDAKESLEATPRQMVTAVLSVTNPTDKKQELITEVKLPEGWVSVTQNLPFELNPTETDTKLISFFVPQTALAGRYEITYVIKNRQYAAIRDFYTVYLMVLPVGNLQVKPLESPGYAIAGEEYQSSFVVTNLGNTEYTINTKVASRGNIPCAADANKFTLAPGESKTVTVTAKTDSATTTALKQRLQLTVEAVEDGQTKAQAQSESFTEIIPRINGTEQPYHTIPTDMTVRYISDDKNKDRESGVQAEIRGEGTLDEEGKNHVKYEARGPDLQQKSVLGERDEYNFSYWTKEYALNFGDRNYSLSELTENYLYGRGLEGKLNVNDDFSMGAYNMKTRWVEPGVEETAAYMDYSINEKDKIGLNYLRKDKDSNVSDITSIKGEFEPFKNAMAELEYALGPGGDNKDNAYLAKLYGHNDWLNYYLKLTHAGPDYPGYYKDIDYVLGGLTVPINKHLRLNASFRQEKSNLDLNPSLYSAPLEKYYQLGADYRTETDTTFSLDWLNRNRKDRLDNPKFDYQEDTLRFGIGQRFGRLNFSTSVEYGKTQNDLNDTTYPSERYTASAYFTPNNKQSYGGYIYYDKNSDFTGEAKRNTTIGLNAQYQIANRTSLNFMLQTNNYQGSTQGGRDNLEIRLSHIFTNNNKLCVLARYTSYENSTQGDDTAFMVEYTIPLGLPVCRKKSIGSIKGHVYDQETQNVIGNAVLRLNGFTAVTDKTGNFTFPSVKPGIYYLHVDTASIGMNRVPTQKTPIELSVQGGEKTSVDIGVARAAQLSGRLIVYSYQNSHDKMTADKQPGDTNVLYVVENSSSNEDTNVVESYGLANTTIELKSGSETKRTYTDNQGGFVFEELRPDKWTLNISSDNLPQYHYLEQDTLELELKPGQKEEISAKVLPQKRRIHIIAEPKTLLEEKQK